MIPYITFDEKRKHENFEGVRLRKYIKNALERNDVTFVTDEDEKHDLAHLLSPLDENILTSEQNAGVGVIISALYAETDPFASYLELKDKESILNPKAKKFLSKGDLILVPSIEAKKFLEENEIKVPIIPLSSGTNLGRFDFNRDDEKELFFRYFGISKKRLVIAEGDYDSLEGISAFIEAAKNSPDTYFYYFGEAKSEAGLDRAIKKLNKNAPKNVRFNRLCPDDIYRSALINADVFLIPGYKKIGYISLVDAMAAKCQIIARKQAVFSDYLEDQKTAYIGEFSETLVALTTDYLNNKLQSTKEAAYNVVKALNLDEIGKELNEIYQGLIERRK